MSTCVSASQSSRRFVSDLLFLVFVHFSQCQEVFDQEHEVDAAQSGEAFPHGVQILLPPIVEMRLRARLKLLVVVMAALRLRTHTTHKKSTTDLELISTSWRSTPTHVRDEVQEGVSAQRAHGQRHQEAEQELEEDFVHERDEDDAEQRQQTDDGDGEEAAKPRCKQTNIRNKI